MSSETKWTPSNLTHALDGHGAYSITTEDGNQVCYVRDERYAAFFASSPKLYEALVYARRFLKQRDHDVKFVDAALASARGEG